MNQHLPTCTQESLNLIISLSKEISFIDCSVSISTFQYPIHSFQPLFCTSLDLHIWSPLWGTFGLECLKRMYEVETRIRNEWIVTSGDLVECMDIIEAATSISSLVDIGLNSSERHWYWVHVDSSCQWKECRDIIGYLIEQEHYEPDFKQSIMVARTIKLLKSTIQNVLMCFSRTVTLGLPFALVAQAASSFQRAPSRQCWCLLQAVIQLVLFRPFHLRSIWSSSNQSTLPTLSIHHSSRLKPRIEKKAISSQSVSGWLNSVKFVAIMPLCWFG